MVGDEYIIDELDSVWKKKLDKGEVILFIGNELDQIDVSIDGSKTTELLFRDIILGHKLTDYEKLITSINPALVVKRAETQDFNDQIPIWREEFKSQISGLEKFGMLEEILSLQKFKYIFTVNSSPLVNIAVTKTQDYQRPGFYNFHLKDYNGFTSQFFKKNNQNSSETIFNKIEENDVNIIHLLGKFEKNEKHLALFDDDKLNALIEYGTTDESRSIAFDVLSKILKDKYILLLGVDFEPWLIFLLLNAMTLKKRLGDVPKLFVDEENYKNYELRKYLGFNKSLFFRHKNNDGNEQSSQLKHFIDELKKPSGNEPTLLAKQFTGCVFISYSRRKISFALKLKEYLDSIGIESRLDTRNISPGDVIDREIRNFITDSQIWIPIISDDLLLDPDFDNRYILKNEWPEMMSTQMAATSLPKKYRSIASKTVFPIVISDLEPDMTRLKKLFKMVFKKSGKFSQSSKLKDKFNWGKLDVIYSLDEDNPNFDQLRLPLFNSLATKKDRV